MKYRKQEVRYADFWDEILSLHDEGQYPFRIQRILEERHGRSFSSSSIVRQLRLHDLDPVSPPQGKGKGRQGIPKTISVPDILARKWT